MVEIKEMREVKVDHPILIEGLPGVGMIGTAATMYLTTELKMQLCGYIESEKFPPFCTIHNGEPLPPARIYCSEKYNLLAILSEFAIPLNVVYETCNKMIEYSKQKEVRMIYSLGGINMKVREEDIDSVYGVGTTILSQQLLEKNKITVIKEGVTTGVTGVLLSRCFTENFPAISLLTPSRPIAIDLMSAAAVLNTFCKMESIPISTEKLVKEGLVIENKLRDLMKNARDAKERYTKIEGSSGPTYR
jgi:uncharacterized protein